MKLIGVDVGGTFTDVVYVDTERNETFVHKVPTTPDDPSQGVMTGMLALCRQNNINPDALQHIYHGTTIATNAVLEYKGARTGIVTTKGFRDILHIGRHQRPQHYSIMQGIPWQERPLAPRRHRKVVEERLVPPKGEVLVPLNEEEVRQAARELKAEGVESIAVCFLFSYLDPSHENRAAEILREEFPEAFVTTSSSVSPQFREFERFTTAALNAFIGPKVSYYINQLVAALRTAKINADLHIMRSNGGVATIKMTTELPVLTLLSGPAAGVLGGAWSGDLCGRDRLITFDIGGTSADIGVVTDGRFSEATARDTWIAGYPVMVPMIDIQTIGAGGGSIAYVDSGGAFHVGPISAGSRPGPAAYRRGGTQPTVTDANLVLGRLDKHRFLGGEMELDEVAARRVIGELAGQLGLPEIEAAEGIITIVNSNMANAIRSRTVQKGIDPREYSLVAFGGAGPLHGVEVAMMLSIPEVIVPLYPGLTSALGLLTTDLKYDSIKTEFQVSTDLDIRRLNDDFEHMQNSLANQFKLDGIAPDSIAFTRSTDARYVGQGYELRVDMPQGEITESGMTAVMEQFHRLHESEYGHFFPDSPIEFVNIRVAGIGSTPKIGKPPKITGGTLEAALVKTGRAVFRVDGELQEFETSFYLRDKLPVEREIAGPAIVLQTDSTTLVPPGSILVADPSGNIIIHIAAEK